MGRSDRNRRSEIAHRADSAIVLSNDPIVENASTRTNASPNRFCENIRDVQIRLNWGIPRFNLSLQTTLMNALLYRVL